jgi:hypothetical protein
VKTAAETKESWQAKARRRVAREKHEAGEREGETMAQCAIKANTVETEGQLGSFASRRE